MSGVMCLFSYSEVHAQNNARREFKFHQENIRSKKRNNDLQKARRVKGRSNQKIGSNFRIRLFFTHQNESQKMEKGKKEGYSYEEYDSTGFSALEIIYKRFGISKSFYQRFYEFNYPERKLMHKWYEFYNLESINISYMFGNDFTVTIGKSIRLLNGDARKHNWNEDDSEYIHYSNNYSGDIYFLTIGFKISFIEFLLNLRDSSNVAFENFECNSGNCGNHEMYRKEPMQLKNMSNFGLGFVF